MGWYTAKGGYMENFSLAHYLAWIVGRDDKAVSGRCVLASPVL